MEEKEALEMLKALKNNWTIDLNKIPDMCEWIEQQLQAYKDREDKLKEYLDSNDYGNHIEADSAYFGVRFMILQILNKEE